MTPQRKILILTNRVPYPLKDGGNLATNAMIDGYYRNGWQVYLLAMNTSRHYVQAEQLAKVFSHLHAFEWVDVNNDVKPADIVRNYLFSKEPEHAARFFKEAFRDKLVQVLKAFGPDVVQVESVYLSTYLPLIDQHSNALALLRVHNIEYQVWQSLAKKSKNPLKRLYFNSLAKRIRAFERTAWNEYDLLLAITEKDAQTIGRLEPIKEMIVAPFSIDLQSIKQGHNERWVGYHIGAMDWIANREGIRWFLDKVWRGVRKSSPGFEFYFAGRSMPDEFKKLDIKGVYCLDEVPSAEDFIADKKMLIVPVWSAGGIRVKILEAMAAGKVVITTPVGIRGIEANPKEHYLLARKPEDFAKAIKWCLENKGQAEQMAHNAHQLISEKYEHRIVVGNVIATAERLLKER